MKKNGKFEKDVELRTRSHMFPPPDARFGAESSGNEASEGVEIT